MLSCVRHTPCRKQKGKKVLHFRWHLRCAALPSAPQSTFAVRWRLAPGWLPSALPAGEASCSHSWRTSLRAAGRGDTVSICLRACNHGAALALAALSPTRPIQGGSAPADAPAKAKSAAAPSAQHPAPGLTAPPARGCAAPAPAPPAAAAGWPRPPSQTQQRLPPAGSLGSAQLQPLRTPPSRAMPGLPPAGAGWRERRLIGWRFQTGKPKLQ